MVQMQHKTPTDFTTKDRATHFSSHAAQEQPSQGGGTEGQLFAEQLGLEATWLLLCGSLDASTEAGGRRPFPPLHLTPSSQACSQGHLCLDCAANLLAPLPDSRQGQCAGSLRTRLGEQHKRQL